MYFHLLGAVVEANCLRFRSKEEITFLPFELEINLYWCIHAMVQYTSVSIYQNTCYAYTIFQVLWHDNSRNYSRGLYECRYSQTFLQQPPMATENSDLCTRQVTAIWRAFKDRIQRWGRNCGSGHCRSVAAVQR